MVALAGRVGVNGWTVERVGGGARLGCGLAISEGLCCRRECDDGVFSDSECASKPPCAFVGGTAGRDQ